MNEKSCCFIGHRKIDKTPELISCLKAEIEKLIQSGVTRFLFGSRSEFNFLCHDIVTEMREKYPNIKRIAYNTKSERGLLESERRTQEEFFLKYFKREVRFPGYEESITPDKMYVSGRASYIERNQMMMDESDYCIFYYDKNYLPKKRPICKRYDGAGRLSEKSGTSIAYAYAKRKKKHIINVFFT